MNTHDFSLFRRPKIYPEVSACECSTPHVCLPPGLPISELAVTELPVSDVSHDHLPSPSRFGQLTLENLPSKTYPSQDYRSQDYRTQEYRSSSYAVRGTDLRQSGYCNNCGKYGHSFHQCKMPITSYGLIVFRKCPALHSVSLIDTLTDDTLKASHIEPERIEYLMIRRRDTLGFIDFMRGKYSVYNKEYILNMIVQMTISEKNRLLTQSFNEIWTELWGNETISDQYRSEEDISRDKFASLRLGVVVTDDFYTLETLIKSTKDEALWEFAEWGFPKGRRNYQEKDYECAVREFCEETGYPTSSIIPIQNILPFEEIFTGSNYKSYKHKYYLTYMAYGNSLRDCAVQSSEVSCAEWKTFEDCMRSIRNYNVEKKRVLENVHKTITEFLLNE